MSAINAIIVAAMDEEMEPFGELFSDFAFTPCDVPTGKAQTARKGRSSILFLTTGVGMVAASSLLSWVMCKFEPRMIISVGSAGGIDPSLSIGDIVIGTNYVHGTADATAFGYVRGQVPGQPANFPLHQALEHPIHEIVETSERPIHLGTVVSSDSFVTEDNVADLREAFPGLLSADMESQALAQVAHSFGTPFVSVRSISDVVGAEASAKQADTFNEKLDDAAAAAARTTLELLLRANALDVERSGHGPAQHFSKVSLQAALYLMLARTHRLEPSSQDIPREVRLEVGGYLEGLTPEEKLHTLGLVVAGHELSKSNPSSTLTAKDYDTHRMAFIESYPEDVRAGFLWPPTSQTVIKRFNGYWNDALTSLGLTPRRGRSRGGLKFTPDDYLFAIRSYIVDSRHSRRQPSFNHYSTWLAESGNAGKLPSGAAIRQRFGSWREALNAAAVTADD